MTSLSSVRFAIEPFDQFLLEEDLFQTHAEYVGKNWDSVLGLNWPLAGSMAGRGELVVISARADEGMVGYAVLMLGADLMDSRVVASLVFLFAKKEWPGVGLRLLREAAAAAKSLGCAAMWMFETGDSEDSIRLSLLSKRLGGRPISTTYEVPL